MVLAMSRSGLLALSGAAYLLFSWTVSDKDVFDSLELAVGAALASYAAWKAYCEWKVK